MKIKTVTPADKIFQVWASLGIAGIDDCLLIIADDKEHAEKIARFCWAEDGEEDITIYQNTQIDLLAEDKDEV